MRTETPVAGSGSATPVLTIRFPGAHLSSDINKPDKAVDWLPAPPPGEERIVQALFTNEDEATVASIIGDQLVRYHVLPNGEAFFVRTLCQAQESISLLMPGGLGTDWDLAMPAMPILGFRRDVGFTRFSRLDGAECLELTGYKVPLGFGRKLLPNAPIFERAGSPRRGSTSKRGRPAP